MNLKEKILELNRLEAEKFQKERIEDIDDILITIISKYQLIEPCRYLSEDDEWVNVMAVSLDDDGISQALSVKKSEITLCGIFNQESVDMTPKNPTEDFYQ